MTPDEFRRRGHELIERIAAYREGLAARPVRSAVAPGVLRARLPAVAPTAPEPFEAIWRDLDELIVPGLTHWQHPRFCGYFPANAELSSVLGDLASSGFGVIGLSWQSSPALTELEEVMTDWFRQMLGLPLGWNGVLQDTASTCTLVALLCARERAGGFPAEGPGGQGGTAPLVVYHSEQAHSSVVKAALLAGFGRDHLRAIPVDADHALRPEALAAEMARDRAAGRIPCAVVATTGTTATTALDPLAEIATLCVREGAWLHVDAAMAGAAMILPECRWMWRGVEAADSIVVNAHKWLGAVFDCSVYFVRDPALLVRVMSTSASYLRSAVDGEVRNLRDWGIPLGRRFRALKLWFLLREQGVEGLQRRLRRDLTLAQDLVAAVAAARDAGWRRLAPVPLQTVCVRHEPPGMGGEALDAHTLAWVERVNAAGVAYLTPALLGGRWMARVSLGGLNTGPEDVRAVWAAMRAAAEREAPPALR
jgi:aromatic-L-amino-acid decarboxylase